MLIKSLNNKDSERQVHGEGGGGWWVVYMLSPSLGTKITKRLSWYGSENRKRVSIYG